MLDPKFTEFVSAQFETGPRDRRASCAVSLAEPLASMPSSSSWADSGGAR